MWAEAEVVKTLSLRGTSTVVRPEAGGQVGEVEDVMFFCSFALQLSPGWVHFGGGGFQLSLFMQTRVLYAPHACHESVPCQAL